MNTDQAHGQRFPPAQKTEIEKAESLLSIQQTFIDNSIGVMIDFSRLVMDNGNSPVGFIEDIFTRLTRRLVFEFLGGHARMQELPCLGDLADGNNVFHRTTPSPTFSKSSQFKLLDSTGHLLPSSIVFMDSDVNPRIEDYLCESVLLDSFDASSTTFISSLKQFPTELISHLAEQESHQCSPINNVFHEQIAGLMAESLCDAEDSESQVFMESDGFSNGINLMRTPIPISSNQSDKEYSGTTVSKVAYPMEGPNICDMFKIKKTEIHNSSVHASNETFAHFAPSMYPLMFNNRLGSITIESCPFTTKNYDVSTRNKNLANEKNLGNSVSSNYSDQAVQTSNNSTSNGDSISSMDCIHLEISCNDKFGDSNMLIAIISTAESSPTCSIPDPKRLNAFLYGKLKFPMFLASELPDEKLDTLDYPSLHDDSDSVDDKDVADLSDSKFNGQLTDCVWKYDEKTLETPGALIELEDGSSSGDYKDMEISVALKISEPCYTRPLGTQWPTLVNSSSFDVSNHEELLESYGLNNQDQTIDVDYTCASPTWPGKVDAAWKEAIQMNLTDLVSKKHSLSSFYDGNSKNSVSSPHLTQRKCTFNTSSSPYSSEDYLSQGHSCSDGFENSIGEPISGNAENPLVYAIPNPNTLNEYLYGNLKSPMFLPSERMDTKFHEHDSPSFFGDYYSEHCADVTNSSDNCNVELFDTDRPSKEPSAFPFDFIDHYKLLESYGLNEQDQYTDDFICKSPTWPGKV